MSGMQEARGVEQNAVNAVAVGLEDRRHRLALGIGVEDVERHAEVPRLASQDGVELLGRRRAVKFRLATAQILHVRALDEQEFHRSPISRKGILGPAPG